MDFIDLYDDPELFIERRPSVFRHRIDAFNEYDDVDFLKRYRFTKDGVNNLVTLLERDLKRETKRSKAISVQHQILAALRFYGSGGPYQLLDGDSVCLSQPSISRVITGVSKALCRRIDDYIKIPEAGYAQECTRAFYDIAQFPGVLGCIDGTHIRIVAPSENPEQFINRRKGFSSINIQLACDHRLKFINVVAKWPGSTHDAFMLRQSNFWDHFENQGNRRQGIILGDSAYPCRYWLMTPFGEPANAAQTNYNKAHRRTRVKIENAIGHLKRRFGLLHVESRRALQNVLLDTAACAVLHNLAKDWNMPEFPGEDEADEDNVEPANVQNDHRENAGLRRRVIIANTHFNG